LVQAWPARPSGAAVLADPFEGLTPELEVANVGTGSAASQ
jgi:hypothetical protein